MPQIQLPKLLHVEQFQRPGPSQPGVRNAGRGPYRRSRKNARNNSPDSSASSPESSFIW